MLDLILFITKALFDRVIRDICNLTQDVFHGLKHETLSVTINLHCKGLLKVELHLDTLAYEIYPRKAQRSGLCFLPGC